MTLLSSKQSYVNVSAQSNGIQTLQLRWPLENDQSQSLEAILLAWALIQHRQNLCTASRFSWGFYDNDIKGKALVLDTSILCIEPGSYVQQLSECLQKHLVQTPLPQASNGTLEIYLNDETIPEDTPSQAQSLGRSASWGNVELQITITSANLLVRPCWREPVGGEFLASRLARSFVEVLESLTHADCSIASVLGISDQDVSTIWQWNKDLPPTIKMCLHDIVSDRVEKQPEIPAVCSWDGQFTYREVEEYSTIIASHLVDRGTQVGDIIPLYFDKSKWTMVAVLGVMKAGGAFVLIEPSFPTQRKEVMISQVGAKLILASSNHSTSAAELAPQCRVQTIDDATMSSLKASVDMTRELPRVPPDSLLYIIFTSGSTGVPKGVKINHETYTTSVLARSTPIGYSNDSRVLDFTSYAFDVSIDSIMCTLVRGGCLCIPSDDDRVNDLSHAIRELGVNMINITPSVARILDPDILPSLRSLGIGGEACSVRDVHLWAQDTRVVVGYGPSECTIGCTVNPNAAGRPYISIGAGTGAVIWLVDPANHDKLVPVGAVGELLVEGPLVGQGYLNDPDKTAAVFINDPPWLLAGGGGVPGRRGRLYKTGDLVRYDPDGQAGFVFVGRKDTQIKLRGQRIELDEIEHHVKQLLPKSDVVADIVARNGSAKNAMIVAFVAGGDVGGLEYAHHHGGIQGVELSPRLVASVASVREKLAKVLPSYMLPAKYIGVDRIPMLVSGKTDRKLLKAFGELVLSQSKP